LRRERAHDRALVLLAKANFRLGRHHGSASDPRLPMGASYKDVLQGKTTPHWGCGCGYAENWASRIRCLKCQKEAPANLRKRAQQADKEARGIKEKFGKENGQQVGELLKRISKLERELKEAQADGDADMEEEPAPAYDYTVEQLQEQRKLLRAQGRGESHEDVRRLTERIKQQQQAKVAALPAPARADRAEREVRRCMAAVESNAKKAKQLEEEMAELQRRTAEHDEKARMAREELARAEEHRDALYESLRSAQARARAAVDGGAARPQAEPGALDGALAASALLPDEALAPLGQTRDQLCALLRGLADAFRGWQAQKAKEVEEEAAKVAADAAAATAARAAPREAQAGTDGAGAGVGSAGQAAAHGPGAPARDAGGGGFSLDEALEAMEGDEFGGIPLETKRALASKLAKRQRAGPY